MKAVPSILKFAEDTGVMMPQSLEDVLRALKKAIGSTIAVTTDGDFLFDRLNGPAEDEYSYREWLYTREDKSHASWHLGQPLDLQSEALISFLHQILCQTK